MIEGEWEWYGDEADWLRGQFGSFVQAMGDALESELSHLCERAGVAFDRLEFWRRMSESLAGVGL